MTINELLIRLSTQGTDGVFHQAKKVPADKLTWSPEGGEGRTILDLCAECALSPKWGPQVVEAGGLEMTPEMMVAFNAAKAALTTVEECERVGRENLAGLVEYIAKLAPERFDEVISMPFGTHEWTVADVLLIHAWNCNYHTGQICYVQTLYGDKEMS